jgi:hypothetical protein
MAEFEVIGAVDLSHSPLTDQRDNAVAIGNLRAGQELSVMGTV